MFIGTSRYFSDSSPIFVASWYCVIDGSFHLFVGNLVSMVTDLKVEDKNEDALSIADSGFGTSSIITSATEVSGLHVHTCIVKPL